MGADFEWIAEGLRGLAVPMAALHEDPANARKGHAVERIAASLKAYGQRKPVVANRRQDGKIEAGNGTYRAALKLGCGPRNDRIVSDEGTETKAG